MATTAGLIMSHAPQLWMKPEDEAQTVDAWQAAARAAAGELEKLELDAVIVVGNDHLHSCFLDMVAPFTVVASEQVEAELFAGLGLQEAGIPDVAESLIDHLINNEFDPSFSQQLVADHSVFIPVSVLRQGGLSAPVIPVLVNCYVPPQPTLRRCYEFGQQIGEWAAASNKRVAVIGTGGMSHYPGTDRYLNPDTDADAEVLDLLQANDVDSLMSWEAKKMDECGWVELRAWAIALGARGADAKPSHVQHFPSTHCAYAVMFC